MSIGALTLAVLALLPRVTKRVPAPLVALPLAAAAAWLAHRFVAGFDVATIGSSFTTVIDGQVVQGIRDFPPANLPWHVGAGLPLRLSTFRPCSGRGRHCLAGRDRVAALGGRGGRHGRTKHDPDSELLALAWQSALSVLRWNRLHWRDRAHATGSATAAVRRSRP